MPNRQQRRLKDRENRKRNLTRYDIDHYVRKSINREIDGAYQDGFDDGVNQAMILLLTIPLEVLINFYWGSDRRKIEKFTEHVLDYYEKWQDGKLDMEKLKYDLWEYGGIRLEESESD